MPRSKPVWCLLLLCIATLSPAVRAEEVQSLEARAAAVISLESIVIDTSRPQPAIPEALRAGPGDTVEDEIVLVKFPGPVTARQARAAQTSRSKSKLREPVFMRVL